ncbi:MAG TPA: PKD domain-containing protein [Armatimonadota bacterium]
MTCRVTDTGTYAPDLGTDGEVSLSWTVVVLGIDAVSGPTEICPNTEATYTVTTIPAGFEDRVTWTGGGNPVGWSGATFTTKWDTHGTKTVMASLCGQSQSVTVNVKQVTLQSLDCPPGPVCPGENATFSATTSDCPESVHWTGGGTPASWDGSSFTTNWDAPGTHTVTATVDGQSQTCQITVKQPTITAISGPSSVCPGEAATFTATVNECADFVKWIGGGNPPSGQGDSFTTTWSTPGTHTVTATVGTSSRSATVTVTTPHIIGGSQTATSICPNVAVSFTVLLDQCPNVTVHWAGGENPSGGDGGTTYSTSWAEPGTHYVTATVPGGSSRTFTVTVLSPMVTSISGPTQVCAGEMACFGATVDQCPASIRWTCGGDPATGEGSPFYTSFPYAGTYVVTATAGNSWRSITVTVAPTVLNVTFLEPNGTVGGTVPIRVQVDTSECVSSYDLYLSEIEETSEHPTDWFDFGTPEVESQTTSNGITSTIYRWSWDTTASNFHNGYHNLQVYGDAYIGNDWTWDPVEVDHEVEVKNLTVSSAVGSPSISLARTPYYVVWDGTAPVTFTVDIEDNDTSDPCDIDLIIYSTDDVTDWVRTIYRAAVTGSHHTFTWDGRDEWGEALPPGTYTFDVMVSQPDDGDSAQYRSRTLWHGLPHQVQFAQDADGTLQLTGDNLQMNVTYTLNEQPSQVLIDAVDTNWNLADTTMVTDQVRGEASPVLLSVPVSDDLPPPFGKGIISAIDDRWAEARDHRDNCALSVNKNGSGTRLRFALQFLQQSTNYLPRDITGLALMRYDEMPSFYADLIYGSFPVYETQTWKVARDYHFPAFPGLGITWASTSGGSGVMNRREHEWDHDPGGPIPHIDDIAQTNPGMPYKADIVLWSATLGGMKIDKCAGQGPEFWEFGIATWDNLLIQWDTPSSKIFRSGSPSDFRQLLRIHPDGGEAYGTDGCIGIGGGDPSCSTQQVAKDYKLQAAKWAGRTYAVNYEVPPGLRLTTASKPGYMPLYVLEGTRTLFDYGFYENDTFNRAYYVALIDPYHQ